MRILLLVALWVWVEVQLYELAFELLRKLVGSDLASFSLLAWSLASVLIGWRLIANGLRVVMQPSSQGVDLTRLTKKLSHVGLGVLLMFPGLLSDIAALFLFWEPLRRPLANRWAKNTQGMPRGFVYRSSWGHSPREESVDVIDAEIIETETSSTHSRLDGK